MTDETDNTLEGVTDNVNTSDDDTAEDWDYFDPDEEDQDTEEAAETDAPDDEEEGETDDEAEAEPDDEPVAYAAENAVVKLPDGSEVPVAELIKGRMLQSDYTRKTQEVANERKAVQADVERMQRITDAFVNHLSALVPDPPSPSLALTDPNRYTAQKAQHEAAMAQVQQLIEMGQAPKEIMNQMSEQDMRRELQEANQRLIEMFPEAASGEGRERFFNGVQTVANEIGFTNAELSSVRDPRIFALAHWAAKGMAAEKARATAKAKVAAAPPATPRKPGQAARKANGNAEAMRKLARTGSLRDALAVDFD